MSLYIEELLIRLLRVGAAGQKQSGPIEAQSRNEVFLRVDKYLASRLSQTLTLDRICRDNLVGRSRLQQIFHAETGGGVMEYFGRRKIEAAKEMIRREDGNFTEIATRRGISVHLLFLTPLQKGHGHDAERIRLRRARACCQEQTRRMSACSDDTANQPRRKGKAAAKSAKIMLKCLFLFERA